MAFRLEDSWVWDFWLADDGSTYHLYYLHAPKSLGDPELRHRNARIGHATSPDLTSWTPHGVVLRPDDPDAFDGTATWTGCVVRGPDGRWRMFYTGARFYETHNIQAIGVATSPDLYTWTKQPGPLTRADGRWYERYGDSIWPEEAWRDPWVRADPGGAGWHMLITARVRTGEVPDRGVIGHARSADLVDWEVLPPLSAPGAGFGHLEVPQLAAVDGQDLLLFSCGLDRLAPARAAAHRGGGVWSVPVRRTTGPYDLSSAAVVTPAPVYSGRVVRDRTGRWVMLACVDAAPDGTFDGVVAGPVPVYWDRRRGVLSAPASAAGWSDEGTGTGTGSTGPDSPG